MDKKRTGMWLAEQIGVSRVIVSKWFSNITRPTLPTISRRVFGRLQKYSGQTADLAGLFRDSRYQGNGEQASSAGHNRDLIWAKAMTIRDKNEQEISVRL